MTDNSTYLAIDPGETIGWATFDSNGDGISFGQSRYETFVSDFETLIHSGLKCIIVEDYRNHGWQQQKRWSRNITSKIIGKIETLAELRGVRIVLQPNTVKKLGYMYAGIEVPDNHSISHQTDAYAHGVYWLQTNGIRPVGKALMEREQD